MGVNTRRVGDNVWLRVNELVLPNLLRQAVHSQRTVQRCVTMVEVHLHAGLFRWMTKIPLASPGRISGNAVTPGVEHTGRPGTYRAG
ncbi:MAG: hypothetical protein CM1200mP18_12570 [Gammaproteobacteria bacterium]|nr:MAG: hypothetical protein CM1200mP18_12570 [Gammaproteobacteria bacterium]